MLFNINLFINLSLSTRATLPTYLTLRNLADAKSLPNLGTKVQLAFMPWLNPDHLGRTVVVGRQPTRTWSIGPICPLFHTSSTRLSVKRNLFVSVDKALYLGDITSLPHLHKRMRL